LNDDDFVNANAKECWSPDRKNRVSIRPTENLYTTVTACIYEIPFVACPHPPAPLITYIKPIHF